MSKKTIQAKTDIEFKVRLSSARFRRAIATR